MSCRPITFNHISKSETAYDVGYTMASYLTDPLCTAHRWYRQISVTDAMHSTASKVEILGRKGFLFMGIIASGTISTITTPIGVLLRFVLVSLQSQPYLYLPGKAAEKDLPQSISLLSWNLCCVPGGYSITDGGVLPWSFRINRLISGIKQQDADVVCLCEVFDIQTAHELINGLNQQYAHFYFNIGPNSVGPSSGLFVASKYRVADPKFIPFSKNDLDGRAKFCQKGVFSFDIAQRNGAHSARIFSTHLQHSEIPFKPTQEERNAREREMAMIVSEMKKVTNKTVIFTGDLNTDDDEYNLSSWKSFPLNKGSVPMNARTWDGDEFCAALVGKAFSPPLNLDYTMVFNNSDVSISTSFVDTGFVANEFRLDALSDHKGLLSRIQLPINH